MQTIGVLGLWAGRIRRGANEHVFRRSGWPSSTEINGSSSISTGTIIDAFNVWRTAALYQVAQSAKSSLLAPCRFLFRSNATPLTRNFPTSVHPCVSSRRRACWPFRKIHALSNLHDTLCLAVSISTSLLLLLLLDDRPDLSTADAPERAASFYMVSQRSAERHRANRVG